MYCFLVVECGDSRGDLSVEDGELLRWCVLRFTRVADRDELVELVDGVVVSCVQVRDLIGDRPDQIGGVHGRMLAQAHRGNRHAIE